MSTIAELQASAWEVERARDLDGLLDHFLPDATFHQSNGDVYRGHDEIRAMTERFYAEFPAFQTEILREFGDGETSAAIEFRATLPTPKATCPFSTESSSSRSKTASSSRSAATRSSPLRSA